MMDKGEKFKMDKWELIICSEAHFNHNFYVLGIPLMMFTIRTKKLGWITKLMY